MVSKCTLPWRTALKIIKQGLQWVQNPKKIKTICDMELGIATVAIQSKDHAL